MNCNKNKKYLSSFNNIQSVDLFAGYLDEAKLQESSKKYIEVFEQRNRVGAYCSDPMQNERVGAKLVGDQRSMHLFKNVCDQDLSSLYPSIYMTINIDKSFILKELPKSTYYQSVPKFQFINNRYLNTNVYLFYWDGTYLNDIK